METNCHIGSYLYVMSHDYLRTVWIYEKLKDTVYKFADIAVYYTPKEVISRPFQKYIACI